MRGQWVRVTHKPSGVTICLGSPQYRTMHRAKEAAVKYLRSRMYMLGYHKKDLKVEYFDEDV